MGGLTILIVSKCQESMNRILTQCFGYYFKLFVDNPLCCTHRKIAFQSHSRIWQSLRPEKMKNLSLQQYCKSKAENRASLALPINNSLAQLSQRYQDMTLRASLFHPSQSASSRHLSTTPPQVPIVFPSVSSLNNQHVGKRKGLALCGGRRELKRAPHAR